MHNISQYLKAVLKPRVRLDWDILSCIAFCGATCKRPTIQLLERSLSAVTGRGDCLVFLSHFKNKAGLQYLLYTLD